MAGASLLPSSQTWPLCTTRNQRKTKESIHLWGVSICHSLTHSVEFTGRWHSVMSHTHARAHIWACEYDWTVAYWWGHVVHCTADTDRWRTLEYLLKQHITVDALFKKKLYWPAEKTDNIYKFCHNKLQTVISILCCAGHLGPITQKQMFLILVIVLGVNRPLGFLT